MKSPLVSIILATYNRAEWLPQSIGSVLDQSYDAWELIVWDDGSQDETQKVVDSFRDNRICYSFDRNHGQPYAINQALKLARGTYIAFLDDDDQWYCEKLSLQVNIMEIRPEIDLLFTNFYNINLTYHRQGVYFEQIKPILENLKIREISQDTFLITSGIPEQLLVTNFVLPSSTIMKRTMFEKIGYLNEQLRNGHDLEYWWRMGLAKAQFAYTDKVLLNRIKPPNSLSSNSAITYLNQIKALDFCFEESLRNDRKDLKPHFKQAYATAWQELIRIYALSGQRKQAFIEFQNSFKYGVGWRTLYLLLGALLGPKLANLVREAIRQILQSRRCE